MQQFLICLLFFIVVQWCAAIVPSSSSPSPLFAPPTVDSENVDRKSVIKSIEQEKNRKRVRLHLRNHKNRELADRQIEIVEKKCNNSALEKIMLNSITKSLSTSKMLISERAKRDFGRSFDVICARGLFSYFVDASTYCEVTKNDVTCFAFQY